MLRRRLGLRLAALLLIFCPRAAWAACANPSGLEGEILYNHDYQVMQFCNGTVWVSMASGTVSLSESDPQVGTLTASNWCKANAGATAIDCASSAISLSTDVSGALQAAQMLALTGDVTNSAGAVATTVGKINGVALGSTTATAGNLLIGSGTAWVTNAVTGDVTITSGGVTAIGSAKVTNAMLAGSIAYGKLSLTGAILNADLAGSIAASKLVGTDIATVGTITSGIWNAGAVTSSGTVTGSLFSGSGASLTALNASNLASGTVATARLGTGTANSSTYLRGDSTWAAPTAAASGSDGYVQFAASSALSSDSALVWDNTNKRLGIGTASPGAPLHISGTAAPLFILDRASGTSNTYLKLAQAGTAKGYIGIAGGTDGIITGSASGDIAIQSVNQKILLSTDSGITAAMTLTGGNIGIGTTSPAYKLDVTGSDGVGAFTVAGATSRMRVVPQAGYVTLEVTNAAQSVAQPLVLQASGSNVGIGTTSPAEPLEVRRADGTYYENARFSNTSAGSLVQFTDSAGYTTAFGSEGGKASIRTNNTQRLAIDTSGNVGIGTTAPLAPLHISAATFGLRLTRTTGNTGDWGIGVGNNPNNLTFTNWVANTDPVTFTGTGNVGIGTTNPGAKVQINQSSGTFFLKLMDENGNYRALYLTNGDSTLGFHNGSNVATLSAAGVWSNASDIRLKKNVSDIPYGLATVLRMHPVHYNMKSDGASQVGFIAQEMKNVVPEVVSGNEGSMTLSYGNLVAVLTKAIQQLKAANDNQAASLKAANDNTARQLEELRGEFRGYKAAHP